MNMFFLFVSLLFLDFKRKRAESRAQINKLKHNADAQISRIASCRMNNGKTTSLGI